MKLNGKYYTNWRQTKAVASAELFAFLEEWFDVKEYVVAHTSGSTGVAKEIWLLKKDMLASAALTNAFFDIREESKLLLCLSPSYIAGKMMIVRALQANAELFVSPVQSRPLKMIEDAHIDLAAMVPMQVEQSLRYFPDLERLQKIRYLLIGGAPLLLDTERKLIGMKMRSYATYGMTETVSHIALRLINGKDVYTALGNVHFATDERECLIIDAPHFQEQRFITNDVVRLISSTQFQWLGRYDHVINSGGIKYFPESIEQKINDVFKKRFFITSMPDQLFGERIVLVLEGSSFSPEEITQLKAALAARLTAYEMPKEILFRSAFREIASGKVKREL